MDQSIGSARADHSISEYLDIRAYEMLPNGIIVYSTGDKAGLLYANREALQICDCEDLEEMKEYCRGDYLNFFHPEDYDHHIDTIHLAWKNKNSFDHHAQYRIITKSGQIKIINDAGKAVNLPEYGKCYVCALTALDRQISYMLDYADELTGLLSAGQFIQYCENFLQTDEKRETACRFHMAFFNIRHFKEYNLEFGSQKGDYVLQNLARIMTKWSTTKILARFGGDQFVAISRSPELYERVRNIVDEFAFEYGKCGMNVDVGIYPFTDYQQDIHRACDLAKVACDSIRNSSESVCVYNEALSRKIHINNYVLQHFEEALEKKYIKVYYQPVMRTLNHALCGMEALARWVDPVIGFLSPADFISVLEDNHLITRLDLFVLEEICRSIRQAEAKGLILIPISFNLSRIDFMDCDIFSEVEKIVKKYAIPRDMINIEITESMVMGDADIFRREIVRFRLGGYQVWMDDFGSGYSSLNVLKDFQFDEIKLDMKFLSQLDDKSKTIIESIVLMAKNLGVQTLAEGVETEEQLAFLRKIGCEKAQGYLFSKPLPLEEILQNSYANNTIVEKRGWRKYYNQIGQVNFITDRALAIVEFNGKNFEYLFVNRAYEDVWVSLGAESMEVIYDSTNSASSPLSRQLREVQRTLHYGDRPVEVIASVRGQYIRLKLNCIAQQDECVAYTAELTNLNNQESGSRQEVLDKVFRMMYALYDSVYLLDMNSGTFRSLVHGASGNAEDYRKFHNAGEIDALLAAKVFIHPAEQENFVQFVDPETIVERLKKTKRGYLVQYFRTLTANGAYVWKEHAMLYIPDVNGIIYCSRTSYFTQPGLIERVAPGYLAEAIRKENQGFRHILQQGVMESKTVNLFGGE